MILDIFILGLFCINEKCCCTYSISFFFFFWGNKFLFIPDIFSLEDIRTPTPKINANLWMKSCLYALTTAGKFHAGRRVHRRKSFYIASIKRPTVSYYGHSLKVIFISYVDICSYWLWKNSANSEFMFISILIDNGCSSKIGKVIFIELVKILYKWFGLNCIHQTRDEEQNPKKK